MRYVLASAICGVFVIGIVLAAISEELESEPKETPQAEEHDVITLKNGMVLKGVILKEHDEAISLLAITRPGELLKVAVPTDRIRRISRLSLTTRKELRARLEAGRGDRQRAVRYRLAESQRVKTLVRSRIAEQRAIAQRQVAEQTAIRAQIARQLAREAAEENRKNAEQVRRNVETQAQIQRGRTEQMRRNAETRARIESEWAWTNYLWESSRRLNELHNEYRW